MTSALHRLMAAHDAALSAYDAATDEEIKRDDAAGYAVDAARDALLDHRPASLDEVAEKATYMLRNRTFTEWDNFSQRRLVEALTPAAPITHSSLAHKIVAHRQAFQAFGDACGATDDAEGDEPVAAAEAAQDKAGDVCSDALDAIIDHQWDDLDDLKRGLLYLAEHYRTTGDGNPASWFLSITCELAGISEGDL